MLASAAAVSWPAATTTARDVVRKNYRMGQRQSKKKKTTAAAAEATTPPPPPASSSSSSDDAVADDDDAESQRVFTSKDLSAWIASRGSTVELVRCPGSETPDVASSAKALGVDVSCIVKSLVFACDGECIVVVTNGEERVDAKKIAYHLGLANKRVRLASTTEAIAEAGYAPGTVPPFGGRSRLSTSRLN